MFLKFKFLSFIVCKLLNCVHHKQHTVISLLLQLWFCQPLGKLQPIFENEWSRKPTNVRYCRFFSLIYVHRYIWRSLLALNLNYWISIKGFIIPFRQHKNLSSSFCPFLNYQINRRPDVCTFSFEVTYIELKTRSCEILSIIYSCFKHLHDSIQVFVVLFS